MAHWFIKILGLRECDLRRWGRKFAAIYLFLSLFCFCGFVAVSSQVRKFGATLDRLELLADADRRSAQGDPGITNAYEHVDVRHRMLEDTLSAVSALGFVLGGAGLLVLWTSALSWRAADLASKEERGDQQ